MIHSFWRRLSNNNLLGIYFYTLHLVHITLLMLVPNLHTSTVFIELDIFIVFISFCFRHVVCFLLYDNKLTPKILVDGCILIYSFIFYICIGLVHVDLHVSVDNTHPSVLSEEWGLCCSYSSKKKFKSFKN